MDGKSQNEEDGWPQEGLYCEHCKTFIPVFPNLNEPDVVRIRSVARELQQEELIKVTGCHPRFAKIWVLHPNGPQPPGLRRRGPPCPYCGVALFSQDTKQCIDCGWDWHDLENPRNLKAIHPQ